MPKLDQQFQLPDGRRLGYDEYGSSDGKSLFYFHGSPSSRIKSTLFISEELLLSLNVRLFAVDRPGMGLSDFQTNRRILDWSQDVIALVNHLGMERFSILAYSLGGPYGLACGFAIPQHLHKVGVVSGAALFTKSELMNNINKGTAPIPDHATRKTLALASIFVDHVGYNAAHRSQKIHCSSHFTSTQT